MNSSNYLKGNLVKSLKSVVVLLVMLCASQYVCAQNITFNQTKVTVKVAIENIRKQAKMSVDYADNVVNVKKVITVAKGKNSLTSVMDKIVDGKTVYTINGKHIVVTRSKAKSNQSDYPPSPHEKPLEPSTLFLVWYSMATLTSPSSAYRSSSVLRRQSTSSPMLMVVSPLMV